MGQCGVMETYFDNGVVCLYQTDARSIPLDDQTVHCVVTSPPYYGLRVYADNDKRGIGVETSVADYVANMVDIFREVKRVLRDDGVCWLNLGDSYGHGTKAERQDSPNSTLGDNQQGAQNAIGRNGMDAGNHLGIPERVVLALQADGWIWRDTIIWAKKSTMPESLAGWRWEQCRVKVAAGELREQKLGAMGMRDHSGETMFGAAQYQDCSGCPKCAGNDGLVLRKGSWRNTSSHEYI